MKPKVILTGAGGFLGERIVPFLGDFCNLYTPTRPELNLTNPDQVEAYITANKPDAIIHTAAVVNISEAEKERGDTFGTVWRTNVEGTQALVRAAEQCGAFVIGISTGSVFSGTAQTPGPFVETDSPSEDSVLSWYAVTKKAAEAALINGAIVRVSHPIGGRSNPNQKRDYLEKMLQMLTNQTLYPLFTDVYFPITYIPDFAVLLKKLVRERQRGVFHPVSVDQTSPYTLLEYARELLQSKTNSIRKITFAEFMKRTHNTVLHSQYYAVSGKATSAATGYPQRNWQEIVALSLKDFLLQ